MRNRTNLMQPRNASNSRPFGGVADGAQRYHAETLRYKCSHCEKLATAILKAFVYTKDLAANPHIAAGLAQSYPDMQVPVAQFKDGPAVRIALAHSCPSCLPGMERAFAHHPDYVFVTIDRGPKASSASVSLG